MASSEPFLPIKHTGPDEIDAADPGRGAPGTDPGPEPSDEEVEREEREFEERMERARHEKPLFRTPKPHSDT